MYYLMDSQTDSDCNCHRSFMLVSVMVTVAYFCLEICQKLICIFFNVLHWIFFYEIAKSRTFEKFVTFFMFYTGPDKKQFTVCRSLSQSLLSVLYLAKVVNVHCYSDHPLRYLDPNHLLYLNNGNKENLYKIRNTYNTYIILIWVVAKKAAQFRNVYFFPWLVCSIPIIIFYRLNIQ